MTDARDRTIGTMLHSQHKQERELVLLREAASALLAACQLMIDGDWITACAAARAAIAQAEAAGITLAPT